MSLAESLLVFLLFIKDIIYFPTQDKVQLSAEATIGNAFSTKNDHDGSAPDKY